MKSFKEFFGDRFKSGIVLGIVIVGVILTSMAPQGHFPDTAGYMLWAEKGFGAAIRGRPIVVQGIFALFGGYLKWFFLLFSIGGWVYLGEILSRRMLFGGTQRLVFSFFALGALSEYVYWWDTVSLSESLAFSLTAILLGGILRLYQDPPATKGTSWLIALSSLALAGTRESFVYLLPLLGIVTFLAPQRWWVKGLCGGVLILAGLGEEWILLHYAYEYVRLPLEDNIFQRMLKTRTGLEYLQAAHVPYVKVLESCRGELYFQCHIPKASITWLNEHGSSFYFHYLLSNIPTTIEMIWRKFGELYTFGSMPIYFSPLKTGARFIYDFTDILKQSVTAVGVYIVELIGVSALGLSYFFQAKRGQYSYRGLKDFGVGMLVAGCLFSNVLISYLGDTNEIWRHIIVPGVFSSMLILWVIMLLIERNLVALIDTNGEEKIDPKRLLEL